jgi:hypothetical protein
MAMGRGHPRVTNYYPPGHVRGPVTVAPADDHIPVTVFVEFDDGSAGNRPGTVLGWNAVAVNIRYRGFDGSQGIEWFPAALVQRA